MIRVVSKDADGFMLVIDSAFPETWDYAPTILNKVVAAGDKPCVVAANKRDIPDACAPERVKEKMDIKHPVIGTIAITGENVEKALSLLMEKMKQK